MNLNEIIAVNSKRLRAERGFSLGKLSELSGVSKVMLSQIEKGESNPTINTLWKIAGGLQVSYTKLIDEQIDAPLLIQKRKALLRSMTAIVPIITIQPTLHAILSFSTANWMHIRNTLPKGMA